MGFFDKLLGRPAQPAGFTQKAWQSGTDTQRAANSWTYLELVGKALGVEDVKIAPQPSKTTLRGTVRGFPLEIDLDNSGRFNDLKLVIGDTSHPYIDLEYALEGDGSGTTIGTNVTASTADEAAKFRALPSDLQTRVVTEMRGLRIRYFRSRTIDFDILMHDNPVEVNQDPVAWLANTVKLAVDMTVARGQVPPGKESTIEAYAEAVSVGDYVKPLAESIARKVFGSKVVENEAEQRIEVRWNEDGVPTRLTIDYGNDDLDLEVQADGLLVDITVEYESDIEIGTDVDDSDPWSDAENHLCFSKHIFITGSLKEVRAHGAMLQALGPLLDELVRTMEANELNLFIDDQAITADSFDADTLTDGGANAVAVAKVVARVAKTLPRSVPTGVEPPVRCSHCRALYYRTLTRSTCAHCGR